MFSTIFLQEAAQPSLFGSIAPFLLILVFFYFFIYRQNKSQQEKAREQRNALKKGDDVVTSGGIYGKIEGVKMGQPDKKGKTEPAAFVISLKPNNTTEIVVDANHVFLDAPAAK